MLNTKALAASASAPKVYVEDVFSTWLYTGSITGSTINNGIDLAGKGGLVWIKSRSNAYDNVLVDQTRAGTGFLVSNSTLAELSSNSAVTAFNSNGFTTGTNNNVSGASSRIYTSWTFRKAAKFFDVVTFNTGPGSYSATVNHSLGSTPGCIIVKCTTTGGTDWNVWHRSLASDKGLWLQSTAAQNTVGTNWITANSTSFSANASLPIDNATYVAYLFAHDAGGFGDSGNDSIIKCGSFTTDVGGYATIDLGWEPQWLLVKNTNNTGENWIIVDNMRNLIAGGLGAAAEYLRPNLSNAAQDVGFGEPKATGFTFDNGQASTNYIYIAIRRGPMKTPTDATKVFQASRYTGTNVDNQVISAGILTDMVWVRQRNDSVLAGMVVGDRLRGQPYLLTGSTAAEVNDADSFDKQIASAVEYGTAFSSMAGFYVGNDATSKLNANTTSDNHVVHAFRRAPGFFDVVALTGLGGTHSYTHNLKVVPELIISKRRDFSGAPWVVYTAALGVGNRLELNSVNASVATSVFGTVSPTSTQFQLETAGDALIINYLFATCPGVSKVGSYTGNGTTLDIDCGFTNGASFVLIKRTDAADNWRVCDSTRGIVSGNDPILYLNATFAEDTGNDLIDPLSSGFTVVDTNYSNVNGATYIFLAVA